MTKTYEREGINYFWSIKNSTEILNKLKAKGFQSSTISTYDFSTLYTTLPHNLIRNQLVDLIENTFRNYCADLNQTLYESFQVQGNENLMT